MRSKTSLAMGLALVSLVGVARAERVPAARALTLDEAIAVALEHNLELKRSRHDLARSQSSLIAAQNRFGFHLNTLFSDARGYQRDYEKSDGSFVGSVSDDSQLLSLGLMKEMQWGGSFGVEADFNRARFPSSGPLDDGLSLSADYSLSYTQPLWGGRGRKVATQALVTARLDFLDGARRLAEEEMRLVVDVTRQFNALLRRKAIVEIDRTAAKRARDRLAVTRLRLEEGLITPIDLKRGERDLRDRENNAILAVELHETAMDDFVFLLGLPIGTALELTDAERVFEPIDVDVTSAVAEALSSRVDLLSQVDTLELVELSAEVARRALKPRLDATLRTRFVTQSGAPDELAAFFKLGREDTWSSALTLSYTFGDKSDDEVLQRSLIALEGVRIGLEQARQLVTLEVRASVRRIKGLERRITLLADNKILAAESLRLAELQYEEDLISTTDLLQDQDNLISAERAHVEAIYDHASESARLDLTLGRYWQYGQSRQSSFLRQVPAVPVVPRMQKAVGSSGKREGSEVAPGTEPASSPEAGQASETPSESGGPS